MMFLLTLFLFVASSASVSASPATASSSSYCSLAHSSGNALQSYWDASNGLWSSTSWWNCANIVEMLADMQTVCGPNYTEFETTDMTVGEIVDEVFAFQTLESLMTADGYDDIQWWALAWIRVAEAFPAHPAGAQQFLGRAVAIWERILSESWDTTSCGGGVWWSTSKKYKNAITNELFLMLSLRLLQHFPQDPRYLQMAQKEWDWFAASGMINDQNLINDGLTIQPSGECINNGQTEWTYNQGVILGGLSRLAAITGNSSLTVIAGKIFQAVLENMVCPNSAAAVTPTTIAASFSNVLMESCDSCGSPDNSCNGDQIQFKGIFARYVGYWARDFSSTFPSFGNKFVSNNAASVSTLDLCTSTMTFGPNWAGTCSPSLVNAATQSSAMDLLVVAAGLKPTQW